MGEREIQLSRRGLLVFGGAGLIVGFAPAVTSAAAVPLSPSFLQTFVRIDPDSSVTVFAKHLDMGQGVWSGLASIVCEELDADWAQMKVEAAPAAPEYANLAFKMQATGGSTSIANSWEQLRTAGVTARAMIVSAAARRWGVDPAAIIVAHGIVRHGDRQLKLGDLAAEAGALPRPTNVTLKKPEDFTLLGTKHHRLDTSDKSDGSARYGFDMQLPDMRVAVLARPSRFGAKLKSFDATAALAVNGVLEVVAIPQGVVVIARASWAAIKARKLLVIDWDESGTESRSSNALMAEYARLAREAPGLTAIVRGDAAAALGRATRTLTADFTFPYLAHAAMEPLSCTGRWTSDGIELFAGFQSQTTNQKHVAERLGLPIDKVALHTLLAGGAFGRRATFTSDYVMELVETMRAAKSREPIKLIWTREDDMRGGYYRPMFHHRISAGLDTDGSVVAADQVIVGQSFLQAPPYGSPDATKADPTVYKGSFVDQYAMPNAILRWVSPAVRVPVHTYRGIMNNHNAFSKEVFIDELARMAGADPLAFRMRHLAHKPRMTAVLKLAAAKGGWGKSVKPGRALGVAVHEADKSSVAQIAEVSIEDGAIRVHRVTCAIDCGFALDPDNVVAQMEGGIGFALAYALYHAITLNDGRVEQGNFDDYPALRLSEMPEIDVHILNSGEPPTGVGEPGSIPTPAAVANAVAQLTGRPVRTMPLRLPG